MLRKSTENEVWAVLNDAKQLLSKPDFATLERFVGDLVLDAPTSVRMDPAQYPYFFYPKLTSQAWYKPDEFELTAVLEANFEVIQEELAELRVESDSGELERHPDSVELARGKWKSVTIKNGSRFSPAAESRLPLTTNIIKNAPAVGELSFVSYLGPGAHIYPHCGPWNLRLNVHLGVVVPNRAGLRVGEHTGTWNRGKCLVFDDSFEHEAWNYGHETRVVLVVNVWHPQLSGVEIEIFRKVSALIVDDENMENS